MEADDRNIPHVSAEERIEITASAKVAVRQYFATQHLWAAQHFTQECAELEGDLIARRDGTPNLKHRSMAVAAVFSSVAFLEALVNEVLQDAADGLHDRVGFRADGIVDPAAKLLGGLWRNGRAVEYFLDRGQVPDDTARCGC